MAVKNKLTINEVKEKLPPEGQEWLRGMTRGELEGTETILNDVGEQSFVENWRFHQGQLKELRDSFWPDRA